MGKASIRLIRAALPTITMQEKILRHIPRMVCPLFWIMTVYFKTNLTMITPLLPKCPASPSPPTPTMVYLTPPPPHKILSPDMTTEVKTRRE